MTPMDDRTAAAAMTAIHAEYERWMHRYCFTRHEDWHPGESRDVLDAAIGRIRGKIWTPNESDPGSVVTTAEVLHPDVGCL